jgi:hypothetical protein
MVDSIVIPILSNAIVLSVLAFIVKSIINRYLERDIHSYKEKLRIEHEMEIEKLKGELIKVQIEHEIKFRGLILKRSEIIEKIYQDLLSLGGKISRILSVYKYESEPSEKELLDEADDLAQELWPYYHHHKIYLTEKTCEKTNIAFSSIVDPAWDYASHIRIPSDDAESKKSKREAFKAGLQEFNDNAPLAMKELEKEFRGLLGAEST